MIWTAQVFRKIKPYGPGHMDLYCEGIMKASFDLITGGGTTDPQTYGGLTPPLAWVMVEPIEYRWLPDRSRKMEMARILPLGDEKTKYPNRTFVMRPDPFMIHMAGVSTGCLAIKPHHWQQAKNWLNKAFAQCTLEISVFNEE